MLNKGPSPYYWLDILEGRLYIQKWKPRNRPCLGKRPRRTCPSGNAPDNFGSSDTRRCRSRLRPAHGTRLGLPAVRRTWVRFGISIPTPPEPEEATVSRGQHHHSQGHYRFMGLLRNSSRISRANQERIEIVYFMTKSDKNSSNIADSFSFDA